LGKAWEEQIKEKEKAYQQYMLHIEKLLVSDPVEKYKIHLHSHLNELSSEGLKLLESISTSVDQYKSYNLNQQSFTDLMIKYNTFKNSSQFEDLDEILKILYQVKIFTKGQLESVYAYVCVKEIENKSPIKKGSLAFQQLGMLYLEDLNNNNQLDEKIQCNNTYKCMALLHLAKQYIKNNNDNIFLKQEQFLLSKIGYDEELFRSYPQLSHIVSSLFSSEFSNSKESLSAIELNLVPKLPVLSFLSQEFYNSLHLQIQKYQLVVGAGLLSRSELNKSIGDELYIQDLISLYETIRINNSDHVLKQKEQIAKLLIPYLFSLKDNYPKLVLHVNDRFMMNIADQLVEEKSGKRYAFIIWKALATRGIGISQIKLINLYINKQIEILNDETDLYHPINLVTAANEQGYTVIPEKNDENMKTIKAYCKQECDTSAETGYRFGLLTIDDLKAWYIKHPNYLHTPYVIGMYYLKKRKYQKARIWLERAVENGNNNAIHYHHISQLLDC